MTYLRRFLTKTREITQLWELAMVPFWSIAFLLAQAQHKLWWQHLDNYYKLGIIGIMLTPAVRTTEQQLLWVINHWMVEIISNKWRRCSRKLKWVRMPMRVFGINNKPEGRKRNRFLQASKSMMLIPKMNRILTREVTVQLSIKAAEFKQDSNYSRKEMGHRKDQNLHLKT